MNGGVEHLAQRAGRIGILINLVVPALIVAVAVALRGGKLVALPEQLSPALQPLFYVLGATALMELVAAYVLRRVFFAPNRIAPFCHDSGQVEQWVVRSSAVVSALGASPAVYGVVIYLLGGDLRQLAFFGMITLLAYRLLRPTVDLVDETLNSAKNLRGIT
jgi:hypothetical protein